MTAPAIWRTTTSYKKKKLTLAYEEELGLPEAKVIVEDHDPSSSQRL